ncbi:MAG: ABC transporter permease [Candidatus Omnitrophica bacterium]|nr:ABC transporter permease [Candidatus Omnitrophota bacterium]
MLPYIIRRVIALIPLFFLITVISFAVIHLAPGKPTDLQDGLNPRISLEARERLAELYGLNDPLYTQYKNWLVNILRLDFGRSMLDSRPVIEKIAERIPITLTINILSLFLIFLIAIPIGVTSALHRYSAYDRIMTVFVFIGFATPTFWLALVLLSFFGVHLRWLPVSGIQSLEFEMLGMWGKCLDYARHLALPVLISAFGGLAGISRYMRGNMLEVLRQDYITFARAKGLSESRVLYKHALRNAVLPIVTILGLSIPALLGGSVIFETIFSIPGMGRLFYEAVMARDLLVVMGGLVISTILTLLGNLIADIAYAYVDPRIRYQTNKDIQG